MLLTPSEEKKVEAGLHTPQAAAAKGWARSPSCKQRRILGDGHAHGWVRRARRPIDWLIVATVLRRAAYYVRARAVRLPADLAARRRLLAL